MKPEPQEWWEATKKLAEKRGYIVLPMLTHVTTGDVEDNFGNIPFPEVKTVKVTEKTTEADFSAQWDFWPELLPEEKCPLPFSKMKPSRSFYRAVPVEGR